MPLIRIQKHFSNALYGQRRFTFSFRDSSASLHLSLHPPPFFLLSSSPTLVSLPARLPSSFLPPPSLSHSSLNLRKAKVLTPILISYLETQALVSRLFKGVTCQMTELTGSSKWMKPEHIHIKSLNKALSAKQSKQYPYRLDTMYQKQVPKDKKVIIIYTDE